MNIISTRKVETKNSSSRRIVPIMPQRHIQRHQPHLQKQRSAGSRHSWASSPLRLTCLFARNVRKDYHGDRRFVRQCDNEKNLYARCSCGSLKSRNGDEKILFFLRSALRLIFIYIFHLRFCFQTCIFAVKSDTVKTNTKCKKYSDRHKKPQLLGRSWGFCLAEKEGFEPSRRF